jgi:hypothetical protein
MYLIEFFTWCSEYPISGLNISARCFARCYVGAPMLLTIALSGTSFLWMFGNLYNLRVLEPVGHRHFHTSSANNYFLRNNLVFHSADAVGCLVSFW